MHWKFWSKNKSEQKESRTSAVITGAGHGGTVWNPRDFDNFANEAYLKNVIAFRCIDEIAKSVSIAPWYQYEMGHDDKPQKVTDKNDPVNKLLRRPNPSESWAFLMLQLSAYLALDGNSFIERVAPDSGPNVGLPMELYSLRPDRMKILTNSKGRLSGYRYTVNSNNTDFDVDPMTNQADVLHLKTFHPTDDFWGAAPTESAAREIDSSNSATQWNKSVLDNEGRPGMVFTLIGAVGEAQFDQLEKDLSENHGGPANAGKDFIISGDSGTKVQPYSWSPKDLDFVEGGRELARGIARGYGVPPMLLGIPGDNTYSNMREARLGFWETTIISYLKYHRDEINNWMYDDESNRYIDYDLDQVPALSPRRDALWERAQASDFLTTNEKRAMVGHDSIGNAGDVILIDSSKIPLGFEEEDKGDDETRDLIVRQKLKDEGYSESEIDSMLGEDDYKDEDNDE